MYEQFENIIGIDRLSDDAELNTSNSGLYMQDLSPLEQMVEYGQELTDVMKVKRDSAIKEFISDANSVMAQERQFNYQSFSGKIGQSKRYSDITPSKTYLGCIIELKPMPSGKLTIKGIGIHSDSPEEVFIYDNFGTLLGTDTIPIPDGRVEPYEIAPIEVEMFDNEPKQIFIFIRPAGNIDQNKINCGCGRFIPYFSTGTPYYYGTYAGPDAWANYCQVGGIEFDSTDEFEDWYEGNVGATNYMNGFILDLEFSCEVSKGLSNSITDFGSDPLALTIAHAIYYKTGINCAEYLIQSDDINYNGLVNIDNIIASMEMWSEKYTEMVDYIAQNLPATASECLCAPNKYGLKKGTLWS